MNNLIETLGGKDPLYSNQHRALIERFAIIGGNAEDLKAKTGRGFSNVYEFFMYAATVGMRKNYRLPLPEGNKNKFNFIQIQSWRPTEIAHYLLMGVLDKSGIDFNGFEDMTNEQAFDVTTSLKIALEEYANGGFDMIQSKLKEDPYYFDNEYGFVLFLKELK